MLENGKLEHKKPDSPRTLVWSARVLFVFAVLLAFNFNFEAFRAGAQVSPVTGQGTPKFIAKWVPSTPMSDLVISVNPTVNSGSLTVGSSINFKGTVLNSGTAVAAGTFNNRFQIDIGDNGTIDTTLTPHPQLTNLAQGAFQQVISAFWTNIPAGTHRVILCADLPPDPNGSVSESNEANNCSSNTGVAGVFTVDSVCGNRIIEGTEQCDDGAANGVCPATCSASCTINVCAPISQCSDGVDNADPEDTLIDYPADPGCTSTLDDDETNLGTPSFREVPPS